MNIRKNLLGLVVGAVLSTGLALAIPTPFESGAHNFTANSPGTIYQRYFNLGPSTSLSPACSANCGASGVNCETFDGQPWCRLITRNTKNNFYRGYSENTANFTGGDSEQEFCSVFDMESGTGTPQHIGYGALVCKVVGQADTSLASDINCAGTTLASCLGNATSANARDIAGVPNNDGSAAGLQRSGGLSPLATPRVASYDKVSGVMTLTWDPASSTTGARNAASYDLYRAVHACTAAPADNAFTLLRNVTGGTTTVTETESGAVAGQCVTFALKTHYFDRGPVRIVSRFLSGNSQAVSIDGAGGAASVYDITAKWTSGNNVEVAWKTSLEDGVRGFYVTRATSENGAFVRVSSLIPAKGEASAYTFVDAITLQNGQKASGLFYKVETIDIDDNVASFGPAKATLPVPGKGVIQQRNKAGRK
jgi:hypothetical protein